MKKFLNRLGEYLCILGFHKWRHMDFVNLDPDLIKLDCTFASKNFECVRCGKLV